MIESQVVHSERCKLWLSDFLDEDERRRARYHVVTDGEMVWALVESDGRVFSGDFAWDFEPMSVPVDIFLRSSWPRTVRAAVGAVLP
jgi:hypothetical protein